MGELAVLRAAAREAVVTGDVREWAFAAICLEKRVCWAIHIAAQPTVLANIAKRVAAPWTLDIEEMRVGSWVKGSQLSCRDLEGRVRETLAADTFFDEAPLPACASSWRPTAEARPNAEQPRASLDGVVTNWIKDTEILKQEMFDEWLEEHPGGTRERFELEWSVVTEVFGV
jgi:hypothetical protein